MYFPYRLTPEGENLLSGIVADRRNPAARAFLGILHETLGNDRREAVIAMGLNATAMVDPLARNIAVLATAVDTYGATKGLKFNALEAVSKRLSPDN